MAAIRAVLRFCSGAHDETFLSRATTTQECLPQVVILALAPGAVGMEVPEEETAAGVVADKAATNSPALTLITHLPKETVWKVLRTGQPPHHEPRHRHVDECLPGGA
jgi:hypothetical protein